MACDLFAAYSERVKVVILSSKMELRWRIVCFVDASSVSRARVAWMGRRFGGVDGVGVGKEGERY